MLIAIFWVLSKEWESILFFDSLITLVIFDESLCEKYLSSLPIILNNSSYFFSFSSASTLYFNNSFFWSIFVI
ncbi:putative transmembrane protein [Mycoplasma leachii 06049]|uniref:Putative transmembrane protein n=1 Tax=Mycoplasma leachii 06049 TaxID=1188244 RepID=A0A2T4IAV9_9MOLU|nr:putative transmembrane protein [Mycoplasma leachii 06049]